MATAPVKDWYPVSPDRKWALAGAAGLSLLFVLLLISTNLQVFGWVVPWRVAFALLGPLAAFLFYLGLGLFFLGFDLEVRQQTVILFSSVVAVLGVFFAGVHFGASAVVTAPGEADEAREQARDQ